MNEAFNVSMTGKGNEFEEKIWMPELTIKDMKSSKPKDFNHIPSGR